jgi:hypothetical protein
VTVRPCGSADTDRYDHGGQISITYLFSVKVLRNSAMIVAESLPSQCLALLNMSASPAKVLSKVGLVACRAERDSASPPALSRTPRFQPCAGREARITGTVFGLHGPQRTGSKAPRQRRSSKVGLLAYRAERDSASPLASSRTPRFQPCAGRDARITGTLFGLHGPQGTGSKAPVQRPSTKAGLLACRAERCSAVSPPFGAPEKRNP